MTGDEGPYISTEDRTVWVPRTVPYLEARGIARTGAEYGDRLVYRGKVDAFLFGFSRDCQCEEVCERTYSEDEPTGDTTCRVPAWEFELVEP